MTEEEKLERSKRVRKRSQGQFYSDFKRVDPRGKSSAEKTLMIKDLQRNVKYQLIRIYKLKYVMDLIRKEYQYKNKQKQTKVRNRNRRIDNLKEEVRETEKELRKRDRRIERLVMKLDDKEGAISELTYKVESNKERPEYLTEELDNWKTKYDELYQKYRALQKLKRYKPVKKVIVEKEGLTEEEKEVRRMAESPVSDREYKINKIADRTSSFVKSKKITLDLLAALTRLNAKPKLMKREMNLSDKMIQKGEDTGLFSSDYLGAITNRKIWFITPKGRELVQEYIDYIKKSKSDLIYANT